MRRVAIVMAMRAEARPVVDALGAHRVPLPEAAGPLPHEWYRATRGSLQVTVAVNGVDRRFGVDKIGTQPAALNAYVTCVHERPDLLISAGTAGGWARHGTRIGDVFVSDGHFLFHDRRIDLPGFADYGVGRYPAVDARALAAAIGAKTGLVTTSDSLDESDDDRRMIEAHGGHVKEMEAAAVAWVAELLGVPVLALKAITDLVDSPVATVEQFDANLATASARLADRLLAALDFVDGRTLAELGIGERQNIAER